MTSSLPSTHNSAVRTPARQRVGACRHLAVVHEGAVVLQYGSSHA